MAYKLISRDRFIPNGFRFTQPETGWQSTRMASFSSIVNSLISHRLANPALVASKGWATDYESVANEVDAFNAAICASMGWTQYIMVPEGNPEPPKSKAPSLQEQSQISAAAGRAKKIWAGVKTLNDWLDSDEDPVTLIRSESRAAVCSACPVNGKGDFTQWFTQPAADAIRRQLEKAKDRKLVTSVDSKLNICTICLCPLKLKVHTPIKFIKEHMSPAVLHDLEKAPACWIVAELKE